MVNGRNNRMYSHGNPDQMSVKELKNRLRMVKFAIIETGLYLDAYPHCQKALQYYHKLIKEKEILAELVNKKCGPMTIFDNSSEDHWAWVKGPWPWEPEAN